MYTYNKRLGTPQSGFLWGLFHTWKDMYAFNERLGTPQSDLMSILCMYMIDDAFITP